MEAIKNATFEAIKGLGLAGSAPDSNQKPTTAQESLSCQEPVSGQQGAGTATDPYDAGNAEGQSGSAPGQASAAAVPKANSSSESLKDTTKDSSLNPTEFTTASATPEPSPNTRAAENVSAYPDLQGHPLPSTADVSPSPIPLGQERAPAQVDEKTQTEDIIKPEQGRVVDDPIVDPIASNKPSHTRDNYMQESSESKPFVEQEAARIAKESQPREIPTHDSGLAASATSPDNDDHDLAESTKKMHLKDKIKEKLHIKKKTDGT